MKINELLRLIDAGFTKEDILKLDADVKIVPDPKQPEPKKESPEDPQPAPAPAPEPQPVPAGVTLSDAQFTKLLQQLNVSGASLDVPPESDMASKLGDHFKELLTGK